MLSSIYDVCFWIGLIAPFVMLLMSGIFSAFDLSMDYPDLSMDGISGDFLNGILSLIPTSPTSILAALLIFGGAGRLLNNVTNYHLVIAIVCGILTGFIVQNCILKPLKKLNFETVKIEDFLNKVGTISDTIDSNGYGEITFESSVGQTTFIAISDEIIKRGEKAVVYKCLEGMVYVVRLSKQ